MWWLLAPAALASERIESAEIDGAPAVVRIDEADASFAVVHGPVLGTRPDWSSATVLSAGMRRWWTVVAVRDHVIQVLLQRDTPAFVERALQRSEPGTAAHLWLATAWSLAGGSLDALPDSERVSQDAARFRQRPQAQPIGVYALDEVVHLAAVDAWLAAPLDRTLLSELEALLPTEERAVLDALRTSNRTLFGETSRRALLPRGADDPLLALIHADLEDPAVPLDDGHQGIAIQPQLDREPCAPCVHLGPRAEARWREEPAFDEVPALLLPVSWSARNRPTVEGFVGIDLRDAAIHYASAPRVRTASGEPLEAHWTPQRVQLLEPRTVRIELDRLPRQTQLAQRFREEPDPQRALADLTPPHPQNCGCNDSQGRAPLFLPLLRVRERSRGREHGHRLQ